MSPHEITSLWRSSFGDANPAGFLCRQTLHQRWVRIHSLPESKRYPENEAEQREILRRHSEAASTVLGENVRCILFVTRFWSDSTEVPSVDDAFPVRQHLAHVPDLAHRQEDNDMLHFFAAEVEWKTGDFDSLILATADNSTGPVLIANLVRGTAYAPYDGGADLFLRSPKAVTEAKELWHLWLSTRDDGM